MHDRSNTHKAKLARERRSFVLTLRSEPGVDAIRSLRRALKTLLRRDGLRVTGIMESADDARHAAQKSEAIEKAPPIPTEAPIGEVQKGKRS
jgi:hypothetical protein